MNFSRRQFLVRSGGATLSAAVLAACGSSLSGSGSGGQIQLWDKFSNTDTQKYFQANFVDAYNKTSKHSVVLSVKPSGPFDQTMQTAVAAGHGPDIIVTDGPAQSTAYAKAGYLAPLDDIAAKNNWTSKLLPWAIGTGQIGGHLYAIPNSYETMVSFFNPATFHKYGWTAPKNRSDFEALCTDAKGHGLIPIGAGTASAPDVTQWYVTIFLNHCAGPEAVYQALQGKVKWTDPVFVDAISLMKTYFERGWYGGSVQNYFTNTFEDMYTKLASGQVAMEQSGSWSFAELPPYFGSAAGNSATWDWAPLPAFSSTVPAPLYTLSVGGCYSVSKKAQDRAAAEDYLNWTISSPQRQLAALAKVGLEPAPIPITTAEFPAGTDPRLSRLYTNLAQSKNVGYTTWTFLPPDTDTFCYEGMNKVITGKMTPAQYCAQFQTHFAAELAAGKVPALPKPN